jgi:hypothetical protein
MVHCIHFAARTDRERLFKQEAQAQGFDYRFWEPIPAHKTWISVRLSHQQIVRHAKETKMPYVIIMEDDVRFTCKGAYQYYLSKKPDTFDIYTAGIYFGKIKNGRLVSSFSGLQCYMVNACFYDAFLNINTDRHHLDRVLGTGGTRVEVCYPMAAIQYTTYSDVGGKYRDYSRYLKDKLLLTESFIAASDATQHELYT